MWGVYDANVVLFPKQTHMIGSVYTCVEYTVMYSTFALIYYLLKNKEHTGSKSIFKNCYIKLCENKHKILQECDAVWLKTNNLQYET
jgi:hypothetical protein